MSDIDSVLKESRVFPPPSEFARKAHIKSLDEYRALNLSENCLDRQVSGGRKDKTAIIWEGEPGEVRRLTYAELLGEVCRFANVLKGLGVKAGDRVGIYMPMIPEAAVAMLACTRIGATHSVVFGGFSYILYTSGTTGKPKGVVHTTGGYLVQVALTMKYVFDIKDEDVYWCTADIGWVTGHSYVVYGPLANGATTLMYEGAPNHPGPDRFWSLVERHKVSVFYTAPTAIRAFLRWGDQWPKRHDLSSLRLLGTVGEPINPEAWMWYRTVIGGERCPIVDTWWQTETGAIMVTPLPGAIPAKPGSGTLPFFGVVPEVVDNNGKPVGADTGGYLVIQKPWPSMLRTVYKDPERYVEQYWKRFPGIYFTGDGARKDKDGYFWIMGRVDDVINVAGHRLGTMEIESDEALRTELKGHVVKEIGALARPDDIRFTEALPKTRSGKIMRRLLRDIAAGKETVGDTTTLEDYSVLARLREEEE